MVMNELSIRFAVSKMITKAWISERSTPMIGTRSIKVIDMNLTTSLSRRTFQPGVVMYQIMAAMNVSYTTASTM